jgi:cytochrome c nitrite reductase small subunit
LIRRFGLSAIGVAACLGVGLVGGLGAYTFDYAEGTSYLSNAPEACLNCHVMRDVYEGWQRSSHHAVAVCNDCHVPQSLVPKLYAKALHGYRHSRAFTMQDFHEPIQIGADSLAMVEANCVRCHEPLVNDILVSPARASHGEGLSCVHCHSHVGHGPRR